MIIKPVRGKSPEFGKDCFIAENATIVGEVTMGDQCSVWFNAVIRGDVHFIKMGNKVNVQDGAVIHCTYEKSPTTIGNNVSIGHNALVHGCTVTKGTHVEAGSIYAGMPAKKIKDISPELSKGEIDRIANNYVKYASWFKEQ